jgi:hypothetical protein
MSPNGDQLASAVLSARSWLLLTKDRHSLQHGGNDGYEEELGHNYRFDSTVPNHLELTLGDRILLWNGSILLGISRISDLTTRPSSKVRHRCPMCTATKIKPRKTLSPTYRCHGCRAEFDEPIREDLIIQEYLLEYSQHWSAFQGESSAQQIRGLAISSKSQHSMRELNSQKLTSFLIHHDIPIQ